MRVIYISIVALLGLISGLDSVKAQNAQNSSFSEYCKSIQTKANSGDPDALGVMADMTIDNYFPGGIDRALKLAKESSSKGSPIGQYSLAVLTSDSNPESGHQLVEKALPSLELKAESGDHYSQCIIGCVYLFGQAGIEKDLSKGIRSVQKAAKENFPPALYILSLCYSKGMGVLQDDKKSNEYLIRSAEKGDTRAMFQLACSISEQAGYGRLSIDENKRLEAISLYKKVWETNKSPKAAICIAELIKRDPTTSLGTKPHHMDGDRALTNYNNQKNKFNESVKESLGWCIKAADAGDVKIAMALGQLYSGDDHNNILRKIFHFDDNSVNVRLNEIIDKNINEALRF
jgi:TPR repeat protein